MIEIIRDAARSHPWQFAGGILAGFGMIVSGMTVAFVVYVYTWGM